jgi:putative oxidoreductase
VKIVATIARYLLGVIFLFFGSNMFFHFLPNPPLPPGPMANFSSALAESHYIWAVGFFQIAPAILLLINRYVPLALTVLAAVIVNIDLTHITMAPSGLPAAAVVSILWLLVFWRVRGAFSGIFEPSPQH